MIVMWIMVWWHRLGLTPNLSTRVLWQPPVPSGGPVSRDISGVSRKMGKENENLVYPSPCDMKRSLTCRKISRNGTSGFTSHLKEGVLRIFIALKKSIALAKFEPVTFGSSGKHNNHYTTKVIRFHILLTLGLGGGMWSASCPSHFTQTNKVNGQGT
jgi:hypothetical protein